MNAHGLIDLQALEGQQISLALNDGSRIDDAQLVSAGRTKARTVWVFAYGMDTFVPLANVVDVWPTAAIRHDAA